MVPFTVQVTRGLLRDERSRRKNDGILAARCDGHAGGGIDGFAAVVESARTSLAIHFLLVCLRLGDTACVVAGVSWISCSFEHKHALRGELSGKSSPRKQFQPRQTFGIPNMSQVESAR